MSRVHVVAAVALACLGASLTLLAGAGGDPGAARQGPAKFGHSVNDRDLRAIRIGAGHARRRVLVVGSIHGDEREGHRIIRLLRRKRPNVGVALWTVKALNPDGAKARVRVNARGVDLNRNFPYRWRAAEPPGSGYYQGPRPHSEPETRAAMRLIGRMRPRVTIWLHQPWNQVLMPCKGRARPERLYARVARMPTKRCRGENLRGTATSWQEKRVGGTAFVVELPGGKLGSAAVRRHARAVVRVANRFG